MWAGLILWVSVAFSKIFQFYLLFLTPPFGMQFSKLFGGFLVTIFLPKILRVFCHLLDKIVWMWANIFYLSIQNSYSWLSYISFSKRCSKLFLKVSSFVLRVSIWKKSSCNKDFPSSCEWNQLINWNVRFLYILWKEHQFSKNKFWTVREVD